MNRAVDPARRREHREPRRGGDERLVRTKYLWLKNPQQFFDRWYFLATHSRLRPMVEAAKTLKRHLPGLLAYTKHLITSAAAEGINATIQLTKANARGYRNFANDRIAIPRQTRPLSDRPLP